MTEHHPPENPSPSHASLGVKIGISAALIAVPVGSAYVFNHLKNAGQQKNLIEEQGAAYDVNAFSQIDPNLIKFQQSGQIATGLKYARAIAIDANGHLLLAGDRKIRILQPTGELLSEFPLDDYPSCLAPGPKDSILVGFRNHIEIYSASGQRQQSWPILAPNAQLTGITLANNEVFLADAGRRIIVRCDFSGKILSEFARRDPGSDTGLVLPSPFLNVATTAAGQLLVSNPGRHRIETYSPDGQLESYWGLAGAGITGFIGCCNPSHLAIMPDGRIIAAEKGIARIKVFFPDGRLDAVVAGPDILGSGAHGFELAVTPNNQILVLEPGSPDIRIFTAKPTTTAGAP